MSSAPKKLYPSLTPMSPETAVDESTTSPDEKIEKAFGHQLWEPFSGPLPGTTSLWAMQKRLSNTNIPQDNQSPTDLLKFLGIVESPSTVRLFQIVECAARDKLPGVSTVSLAKKWFTNLATPAPETLVGFDNLSSKKPTTVIGGASVRLLSRDALSFGRGGDGGRGDEEEKEGGEEHGSLQDIVEKTLTSGVPPGYRRFFHGTDAAAAHNILNDGIRPVRFVNNCDFGPAFYTTENCNLAFMFSIYGAAVGCGQAAGLSFDVPEAAYSGLKIWQVDGPEWSMGNETAEVAVGEMSHRIGRTNPDDSVVPFRGLDESSGNFDNVQHAFRGSSASILTADMAKVSALLFEVH